MKLKNPLLSLILILWSWAQVNASELVLDIYKTPSCGCCQKWVDHMTEHGFLSELIEMDDLSPIKSNYGVAGQYRSCHTGVAVTEQGDFVFEGHVPAEYVKAFLASPPEGALGLSVPGMPVGSPGMEVGDRKDYYQVLLLKEDGSSDVYAEVNATN